jgi:hypothetical protein
VDSKALISVRAFEPSSIPDERRHEIADELRKYFTEVDANRSPASPGAVFGE